MAPIIFHLDIDAFFASVEQVLDPTLAGRPVIVGGRPEDRSVVASASYQARARGVKTGMPIAQAHRLCPDGVFLRGSFAHYQRASEQVFAVCCDFSPVVEPASIDEGYLDMTGTERLWGSGPRSSEMGWAVRAAVALRNRVLAATGLHVSVGIGTNRLIARIATDLAKPNGVCLVVPGCEAEFLARMPVEVIPGIGPKTAARLGQAGLITVSDLRLAPPAALKKRFGMVAGDMSDRSAGRDERLVIAGRRDRRSISRESSFDRDEPDRAVVLAMLYYLTERAAWTLRNEGLLCRAVSVKLRYADFTTPAGSVTLVEPTDHEGDLFAAGRDLISRLDRRRQAIRLIGICLERLERVSPGSRQFTLFDEAARASQRQRSLHLAQDAVRRRFGFSSLVTGRSIDLLGQYEQDANGFKLRTSCLTR